MSTEHTIFEGEKEDWFINRDLISGEIRLYKDYYLPGEQVVELTDEIITAIKSIDTKK